MMINQLEEHDPSLFKRTDGTFIDLYMKSGMYITEIVKKLAEIGEAAASDKATMKTELVKIRDVLMTWMVYAQNFPEQK